MVTREDLRNLITEICEFEGGLKSVVSLLHRQGCSKLSDVHEGLYKYAFEDLNHLLKEFKESNNVTIKTDPYKKLDWCLGNSLNTLPTRDKDNPEKKTYKPRKYWTTREGRKIDISTMDDNHLLNTVKMLRRKGHVETYTLKRPGDSGKPNIKLDHLMEEVMRRDRMWQEKNNA